MQRTFLPGLRALRGIVSSTATTLVGLALCVSALVPSITHAEPIISQVSVGTVTSTTAVITWATSVPADSFVAYAIANNDDVLEAEDANPVTSHSITLTGLKPATKYEFVVNSQDSQGLNASETGAGFTTLAASTTTPTPPPPTGGTTPPPPPPTTTTPPPTTTTIANYPTGTLAVGTDGKVYFLMGKDKVKIQFTTPAAFTGLGYQTKNVKQLDVSSYRTATGYTISSEKQEHPWGSWLKWKDGTLYYSSPEGMIGVPSMAVFTANGGTLDAVVPMNEADDAIWAKNPNVPILKMNDNRIL